MNEGQVSIDGKSHPLPQPFMVIATQNPVNTRHLPAAGSAAPTDFLMRLRIGYPDLARSGRLCATPNAGCRKPRLGTARRGCAAAFRAVHRVSVEESAGDYMLAIVEKTPQPRIVGARRHPARAAAMYRAVQALALLDGRDYATPDDVKTGWPCRCSRNAW